jgi:prepilin-type N-terminal cleavage/methylation domain-containing protein/prepilin-type processing-associated H-X9-DG protein
MKTMRSSFQICRPPRDLSGFTFTEMLVVIAVLGVLVSLFLALATGGASKTKRAQCAANLRQFNQAMHIYGNENNGKLPVANGGNWPWDLAWSVGNFVESTGSKWTSMFCPGTSPYFTQTDNWQLYNYVPGNFRVIGYAHTLPGSGYLFATNINNTLLPEPIQVGGGVFVRPRPAERVLFADATISGNGQIATALKYSPSYNYTSILGGFIKPHVTAHLKGRFPVGGNVTMLDGHVEWRKFDQMVSRVAGGSVPGFWW